MYWDQARDSLVKRYGWDAWWVDQCEPDTEDPNDRKKANFFTGKVLDYFNTYSLEHKKVSIKNGEGILTGSVFFYWHARHSPVSNVMRPLFGHQILLLLFHLLKTRCHRPSMHVHQAYLTGLLILAVISQESHLQVSLIGHSLPFVNYLPAGFSSVLLARFSGYMVKEKRLCFHLTGMHKRKVFC